MSWLLMPQMCFFFFFFFFYSFFFNNIYIYLLDIIWVIEVVEATASVSSEVKWNWDVDPEMTVTKNWESQQGSIINGDPK